jgi:3-mercaptopyruvate sulfurtransferase SseA
MEGNMIRPGKSKPLFLLIAGIALIVVACAPSTPQAGPAGTAVEAPGEVERVTLEESKAAFDSGEAIFLDVRGTSSYAASHIPGALSIPLAELEPRIGELDPDQWIITYCT